MTDEEIQKELQEKIIPLLKQGSFPHDDAARLVGQFLYFHNKIEQSIESLIISLMPSLGYYLDKKKRLSFEDKLILLKCFSPYHEKIKLFELISFLNAIRNKLAHREYQESLIDTNTLSQLLNATFSETDFRTSVKSNIACETYHNLVMATRAELVVSHFLEFLTAMEKFGKAHPEGIKIGADLQKIGNDTVFRRFSIVMLQLQTGKTGKEVKEHFDLD